MRFSGSFVVALLLTIGAAHAQAQQPNAAQTALAINDAIGRMALSLDNAERQVAALQKQLTEQSARIADLTKQCGDRCEKPAAPAKP